MHNRIHPENINTIDIHIANINTVIELMKRELTKNNGHCGGKINFGDYTSPIAPFDNGFDWLTNRFKPQSFKSIFAILELGIKDHQKRIEILERIKNNETIYAEEQSLLVVVKALAKDPTIVDYEQVYISRDFNFSV